MLVYILASIKCLFCRLHRKKFKSGVMENTQTSHLHESFYTEIEWEEPQKSYTLDFCILFLNSIDAQMKLVHKLLSSPSYDWQKESFYFDLSSSNTNPVIFLLHKSVDAARIKLNFDRCHLGLFDFKQKRRCDIYLHSQLGSKATCYVNSTPVGSRISPAHRENSFRVKICNHSILYNLREFS